VLPIPLDSVQEFRVTVGAGRDEGRSSWQVALITKSVRTIPRLGL